jgi:CHASE2 domain-containing sensor protein/nitrogen-specific signal transduction histidine kinase
MRNSIYRDQLLTALILTLLTLVLSFSQILERFDPIFYDIGQTFSAKLPPEEIVIIAIDERSLDAIGKWPWRRNIHAQLLETLQNAKPKALGVDILFSEADIKFPEDDDVLRQALSNFPNLVLPTIIDAPYQGARLTQIHNIVPLSNLPTGRVNVPLDSDGIARGIYLWEALSTDGKAAAGLPHFSMAVLNAAQQLPEKLQQVPILKAHRSTSISQIIRQDQKKIRFYGPPGHFKHFSYSDVLFGAVPPQNFADKIVLVGATAVGMGDVLATPVSGLSKPMPGVEFHANAIETMKNHALVDISPRWLSALICALLAVMPLLWLPRCSPAKSLMIIAVYFVFVVLLTLFMPIFAKIWLPTTAALLSILLAYPVWSWRRLERAHAFLNQALQQLSAELKHYGESLSQEKNSTPYHLDHQIAEVKRASQLLHNLQNKRNETLSFISHDLRTPLSTALMLLKNEALPEQKDKIIAMLARANHLADSFLQLSKAENILPTQFKPLQLNSLLQEVIDNLYEIAKAKKMKFDLRLTEAALWVNGDYALIQRVFENLLQNAVKYGGENSTIHVRLAHQHPYAEVQICNQGEGISPEKIPQLFQKFSQLHAAPQMSKGSGLGLYFVWLTLEKHGGNVQVTSEPDGLTTFTVHLPLENIN